MNFKVGDVWISSKKDTYIILDIDNSKKYYPILIKDEKLGKVYSCDITGKIVTSTYKDLGKLTLRIRSCPIVKINTNKAVK